MSLCNACRLFLMHHSATVNVSSHTTKAYAADLRQFQGYMGQHTQVADIRKENLRDYILDMRQECQLKETTIKRRIACLKLFFRWARAEELTTIDPFETLRERIRLPRRLPKALAQEEISRLKVMANRGMQTSDFQRLTEMIAIALLNATGVRVGELVNISLDDLDLPTGTIRIHGKGNRQRIAYVMDPALSHALGRYLPMRQPLAKDTSRLLVTAAGTAVTTDYMRQALRRVAKRAGLPRRITPHMLRHTAASSWLQAGLDIRYVQKLLGHHSIATTEIYTHVTDNDLRAALQRTYRREGR